MELIGLYVVACVLLVVAGIAKAIRPDDTARALAAATPLPMPLLRGVIRCGSIAEAALGAMALALPRTVSAGLVALSYLCFASVVAYARSKGGAISSCGCFGTPDTPATTLHVVVDVALGIAAALVASAGPTGSIASVLSSQPLHGVPLVMVSGLCAWLTYLAISVLAELEAARRLVGISRRTQQ
ncbi:MAG TPA: MauE/DoxX family redox-associated membrane protein [Acidimicrobiales bacterium]|nr:MauE/DoxX family redox-associated membrane protein [Acidimicrobiales bacterium]